MQGRSTVPRGKNFIRIPNFQAVKKSRAEGKGELVKQTSFISVDSFGLGPEEGKAEVNEEEETWNQQKHVIGSRNKVDAAKNALKNSGKTLIKIEGM